MNRKIFMTGFALFATCAISTVRADTWTDPATGLEWNYIVNDDGTASVGSGSPYTTVVPASTTGALTVPGSLGGRVVTAVADYAFTGCDAVTTVTLPFGVTNIGDYAFHSCAALSTVEMPSGVKNIGSCAFQGCEALTSIVLPEGLVSVGLSAFEMCCQLESVSFPSSLESIGAYAFFGCDALTEVNIPARVTSIGGNAFYFCSALSSVVFFGDAPQVGTYAFDFVPEDCKVSVLDGTRGWPEVGAEWNGMTVARLGFSDYAFPAAIAVPPGASFVVFPAAGETLTAERAASLVERVTVVPRDASQNAMYFKARAAVNEEGAAVISTELDLVALEFSVTSKELLDGMMSVSVGSDVSVALKTAKPGFWYGVKAASDLKTLSDAAETVVQAGMNGAMLTVVKPQGSAAFFKVEVRAAK